MKQIAEMFYKLYENSKYEKMAVIDCDSLTNKFLKSLNKEQFRMFLEMESAYLNYATDRAKTAIQFLLSLLIDQQ